MNQGLVVAKSDDVLEPLQRYKLATLLEGEASPYAGRVSHNQVSTLICV